MPHSIARATAPQLSRRSTDARPRWIEAGLLAAVIGALLPWFDRFAADDLGRDRRFAEAAIEVRGLPDPVLPSLCEAYGASAEAALRERLCRGATGASGTPVDRIPSALAAAGARIRSAFVAPLADAQARLSRLRQQQREGAGDLLAIGDAIDAAERDVAPFIKRYQIDGPDGSGPLPVACASDIVGAALAAKRRTASAEAEIARANAVLLLGAGFDGHPATAALADSAVLPAEAPPASGRCAELGLTDALAQAAALMADARRAPTAAIKNESMRMLFHTAGWQWAAWMLVGFGLLQLLRRSMEPAPGYPLYIA